jgi:hypothetical protein
MALYDASFDFRRSNSSSSSQDSDKNYFPASSATYCDATDAQCFSCLGDMSGSALQHPSAYCTGTGGCVCVSICESSGWAAIAEALLQSVIQLDNDTVPVSDCVFSESLSGTSATSGSSQDDTVGSTDEAWTESTTTSSSTGGGDRNSSQFVVDLPIGTIGMVLGAVVALVLVLILYITRRNHRRLCEQQQRRSNERRARSRSSSLPSAALTLPAWKALQQELIENEQPVSTATGRLSLVGVLDHASDRGSIVEVAVHPSAADPVLQGEAVLRAVP